MELSKTIQIYNFFNKMNVIFFWGLIIFLVCSLCFLYLLLKKLQQSGKSNNKLVEEKRALDNKICSLEQYNAEHTTNQNKLRLQLNTFIAEQKNIAAEKKQVEEKNKKVWKMSEAALKEKHRLEEINGALQQEKQKLETEKSQLDEKIKKLWQTSITIHKEKEKVTELLELLAIEKKKHLEYIKAQGDVLKDISYVQSHEIRGPLSTIMGLVQLFNYDDPADPENIELLEGIAMVSNRLDKIVTEVVNKENNFAREGKIP